MYVYRYLQKLKIMNKFIKLNIIKVNVNANKNEIRNESLN